MTNQQILKKAIEKAIDNEGINPTSVSWQYEIDNYENRLLGNSERIRYIIFSHSFAKAFWGEEEICIICQQNWDDNDELECCIHPQRGIIWQCHLRRMVLEEEPLKYLEKFL